MSKNHTDNEQNLENNQSTVSEYKTAKILLSQIILRENSCYFVNKFCFLSFFIYEACINELGRQFTTHSDLFITHLLAVNRVTSTHWGFSVSILALETATVGQVDMIIAKPCFAQGKCRHNYVDMKTLRWTSAVHSVSYSQERAQTN